MTAIGHVDATEKMVDESIFVDTADEFANCRWIDYILLQLQGKRMNFENLDTRAVAWCAFWIAVAVVETVLLFVLFPIK